MDLPAIITPELIGYLRTLYRMDWHGIHGWPHWLRVWENGSRLAARTGANLTLVALFAFTHDVARLNDGWDVDHGRRAAEIIHDTLQGKVFQLNESDLNLLLDAVTRHSQGILEADPTVQTCWDADRLDLGRVGYRPDPALLCTPAARDPGIIEWAYERSLRWWE